MPSFGEMASEFPQVRSTFQPNALSAMAVGYESYRPWTVDLLLSEKPVLRQVGQEKEAAHRLAGEPGQLQGPWKQGGFYALFRVTNRVPPRPANFEEAQSALLQRLQEEAMDRYLAALRLKYAALIHVDDQALGVVRTEGKARQSLEALRENIHRRFP